MNTSNFRIRTRKNNKIGSQHLMLEGEIGINYIAQIKTRIDSINFESKKIFIELKNIDSFDLSSVQLLYSLRKFLGDKGKMVTLVSDIPEITSLILRNAGFDDFIKS